VQRFRVEGPNLVLYRPDHATSHRHRAQAEPPTDCRPSHRHLSYQLTVFSITEALSVVGIGGVVKALRPMDDCIRKWVAAAETS